MSNVARHPWIVFGANPDGANKGIEVGWSKKFGGWTCTIYELVKPVKMGARFEKNDIQNKITSLVFCQKESLEGFIKQLVILKTQWDIKEVKDGNKTKDDAGADGGTAG